MAIMSKQPGFFDADERLKALSAAGDPLERLRAVVDFEPFRSDIEAALERGDRSRGGRPPYDAVLMFRILVLQTLYTLSDDQTEYQLDASKNLWRRGVSGDSLSALGGMATMSKQPGFFDADERLKALSAAGDPLERLRAAVDFELFRGDIEAALERGDRNRGGRPPYDAVLMFRILVLQTLYTLSDD
jgi:hypothetical protein